MDSILTFLFYYNDQEAEPLLLSQYSYSILVMGQGKEIFKGDDIKMHIRKVIRREETDRKVGYAKSIR